MRALPIGVCFQVFSVSFGHIYISPGRETAAMCVNMYFNSSEE